MNEVYTWNQLLTWTSGKSPFVKCQCLTYTHGMGYRHLFYMQGAVGWAWYTDAAGEKVHVIPGMWAILSGSSPLDSWPPERPLPQSLKPPTPQE